MLLALLAFVAIVAALNWIANPYRAWRLSVHDGMYGVARDGFEPRVLTPYRVRTQEPTTLLVGNSRVQWGMSIDRGYRDGILNAALPNASLAEIAAILRLAVANPRLERVIWGVDFFSFDEKYLGSGDPDTLMRLEPRPLSMRTLVSIQETLFSAQALDESGKILLRAMAALTSLQPIPPAPPAAWPERLIQEKLDESSQEGLGVLDEPGLKTGLAPWVAHYQGYRPSAAQLAVFRGTVARTKAARRELILFIPPISTCELEAIDQTGHWGAFQHWKRELVDVAPYWDFANYGQLERSEYLFQDIFHMKQAVGHVILRQLLALECKACGPVADMIRQTGVWVDGATVDRHLAAQEALRMTQTSQASRCGRAVQDLLRGQAVGAANGDTAAAAPADRTNPGRP